MSLISTNKNDLLLVADHKVLVAEDDARDEANRHENDHDRNHDEQSLFRVEFAFVAMR